MTNTTSKPQTLATSNAAGEADTVTYTMVNGKAWALVNNKHMFSVAKVETLNPTARGGAYKTEWMARPRGHKVYAATRKAAVEAAVKSLRERGFTF